MANREVTMPALSPTMEEGELIRWRVRVGDEVKQGQALAEFETDKVDTAVESPYAGTIADLLAREGEVVAVGAPFVRIDTDAEDLLGDLDLGGGSQPDVSAPTVGEEDGGAPEDQAAKAEPTGIVPAPPPIRSRAKRLGVDLSRVERTGSRGQVTNADLDRYLAAHGIDEHTPTAAQLTPATPAPAAAPQAADTASTTGDDRARTEDAEGIAERRRRVRRATARTMERAAAVPQFTLHRRVELTRAAQRREGRSWTTEIVRASAAALRAHPRMGARWDAEEERAREADQIRIGLAVDTPQGLLVVGISEPDRLSPAQADHAVRDAVQRAIDDRLDPRDTADITFTVSNLGGLGVDWFRAVVVPPQAAILSVGRITDLPMVVDGRVRARLGTELGLTVDHRVVDGADAARFLSTLADVLED